MAFERKSFQISSSSFIQKLILRIIGQNGPSVDDKGEDD